MRTYKDLYFYLFGAIADAVEELERGEVILALQSLIMAQQEAEDRVLELDVVPETYECRLQDFLEASPEGQERISRLAEMDEA